MRPQTTISLNAEIMMKTPTRVILFCETFEPLESCSWDKFFSGHICEMISLIAFVGKSKSVTIQIKTFKQ